MPIDRRQFGQGVAAAFAVLAGGGAPLPPAFAAAPADVRFARTALDRLTFGARREDIEALDAIGYEAWLDAQLSLPPSDPALSERLAAMRLRIDYGDGKDENGHEWRGRQEMRPLAALDQPDAAFVDLTDWDKGMDWEERIRPAREVQAASLIRACHARAQVREVLTQFWHDHFSVNAMKDAGPAAFFASYDRMLREKALGNFRDLLGAVARAPSMLAYLNNAESKASPANENYARELFELHTLGAGCYLNARYTSWRDVPGAMEGRAVGYIDQDVYEAARAFTGWTIGDGRYLAEGDKAPRTGTFFYHHGWHDPYQKRVLGHEFAPNAAPMADGERVLDMVAIHPGTARFIATKLVRRLLADDPPEALVARVAAAFITHADANDQIGRLVRLIAMSDEFRAMAPSKMRRPFEFLAALYRAAGAEAAPTADVFWQLQQAGWRQHEWRPPTGHPDTARHWASTASLSSLCAFALNAFEPWFGGARFDAAAATPAGTHTARAAAIHWSARLLGAAPDAGFVEELARVVGEGDADASLAGDDQGRAWQVRSLIAMIAMTPEFLTR